MLSALEIYYTLTPARYNADGDVVQWSERETVAALYVDRTEVLADDVRVFDAFIE